jgi:acrylyl-CoA reductase (NADPH)
LPEAFSAAQAMAIGTAGYTAMLCILALERNGVTPDQGEVLVTGANGGQFRHRLAQQTRVSRGGIHRPGVRARVPEATGRQRDHRPRNLVGTGQTAGQERWAGVIDSVGSHTLANACASTRAEGTVAACGLAQGMDFPASVAPFILRGVTLAGINSVTQPKARRIEAWKRLAKDLDFALLPLISHEIALSEAIDAAPKLLAGQLRGRVVVDVNR